MAALKMDELFVTWLSTEGVYESVMSLIEQHKDSKSNRSGAGSMRSKDTPPLSPAHSNKNSPNLVDNKKAISSIVIPRNEGGRGRGRASPDDSFEAREKDIFDAFDNRNQLNMSDFGRLTKALCKFPSFFTAPLFRRICELYSHLNTSVEAAAGNAGEVITIEMFCQFWKDEMAPYDGSDRFFRLVKKVDAEFIDKEDFRPFIDELLNCHPGLEFLANHREFQEKYATTVITRIFYVVNTGHDGKITARQVRRSNLQTAFLLVDDEEDINKVTQYFSYEHFYVLYCRFWELDQDRDYKIARDDLIRYNDQSLSMLIVDRIFAAAPRPFANSGNESGLEDSDVKQHLARREYLSYEDFIFFMLSEEDKANEVSVRYWFSCIDVLGEGKINFMEMRRFYALQLQRMQNLGHEIVPFEDMLCQMLDMIKPANPDCLIVDDFLQPECCQVSGALFDALFNLNKYLQFEQRDPFMERQKREDEFDSEWDRFACVDYSRLAQEEEAREEEAMEIDWVTVDDDDDDGDEFMHSALGGSSREAPF
eukprot:CAMPEP_0116032538 /NCGR_PEP_ID=MMETSP0321-20121206/18231_1 /TAXON_ID=163516 /ORGANISM="Leptocylindrus danicus var. danicus, Strain B650" /LENGTH=536 /DNA_ID=CAMNT_0003507997 /DNA_START=18 /DNA_END=1628 /DNA_ORIENTATION=+